MFVQEATGYVDIDDIGNFAISVTNDMYKEWVNDSQHSLWNY